MRRSPLYNNISLVLLLVACTLLIALFTGNNVFGFETDMMITLGSTLTGMIIAAFGPKSESFNMLIVMHMLLFAMVALLFALYASVQGA